MTPSDTSTEVTPGTVWTAAVTSRVIRSRSGHPWVVSRIPTATRPSAAMSIDSTMPRSVIGRWISGSETVASAAWTVSCVGRLMAVPRYVGRSGGEPRAALNQRQHPLFERRRFHRLGEVVVGAGVARLGLQRVVRAAGQHEDRKRSGPCLAPQQADQLDAG